MAPQGSVPFFEMFPDLGNNGIISDACGGAYVIGASVEKENRIMNMDLMLPRPTAPAVLKTVEDAIGNEFGLTAVNIKPFYEEISAPKRNAPDAKPPQGAKDKTKKAAGKTKPEGGSVIMGGRIKGDITPISEINLESGGVIVRGDVFDVTSREIAKRNAYVLCFDMSDGTNSIRVSRYISNEKQIEAAKKVKKGMYLTVQGNVTFNRYDNDIVIDPKNINESKKEVRADNAERRRVELHLHTQMSAMDATTNIKSAVKRAIEWGHPAIAVTDHGVCQAFPDAMSAAGDRIKVLYGVEGYYVNDIDDRPAILGGISGDFSREIAVFDIETTGLDPMGDAITEIGAVIMKDGKEISRFQTFVNPERKIPQNITLLTGIKDDDVKNAPSQKEAVEGFLEFVGERPLCAHNASFDVAFIWEVSERCGIDFEPNYIDTLALSQGILTELRSHTLDAVAGRLGLPEFNHHRASDDAVTTGLILNSFLKMLKEHGVIRLEDVNEYIERSRRDNLNKRRYKPMHIVIIAKNQAGIRNLYTLVTKSHLEHFRRYPIIPKSLIMQYREGLIIGSACESGEVFRLISGHKSRLEQRRLAEFYDYLEIQPVCNNMFMLRGEKPQAESEEQLRDFNRRVCDLGQELGKPVVGTCDVHFLDPEDEIFRHILLTTKDFSDADKELPLFYRTTDEMLKEFEYLGEEKAYEVVVENTNLIADMCDNVRPLPEPILYPPKIENSANELKELVFGKMRELYGDNPPDIVKERIDTELDAILGRGYDVIYMSAQKLVADSLAHGYLVGSRGSVGSSLVAYMSGITEVNSLPAHYRCPNCKHTDFEAGHDYGCGADMPDAVCPVCGTPYKKEGFDIPFETFLGFGGDKVPDIDLNFSGEYQANAHKYTNELFGSDHVFRAGTIGTVAEKTAYGYVRKYLEKTGKVVTRAEENRLALGCVGVKRTTGQHPGGLVVIPQDMEIVDFCPAQHPADDSEGGIVTTHFEYHCMEANLLKLDELGHDDPTMIKMLEDMTGIDAKEIPLDDKDTMGIFSSAAPLGLEDGDPIIGYTGSIGIPEFGTGFTRQMLCDVKPEKFDTLLRLSGFSHGTDVWLGNAKELIMSGTATVNETIGCRDDIMLYLISKGMPDTRSFKIMESVRKGRGLPDGAEEEMTDAGVPDWYIESCKKIKYLFPKAHATAYVMMAFRIAWFKVHEPMAFYSAYFYRRSQKDAFDAEYMTRGIEVCLAKIREIDANPDATAKEQDLYTTLEACYEFYKRGFEFSGVDLYKSDAVKFKIDGNRLIPPFVAVSGLGETAARDLAKTRDEMEFISIEDIISFCPKVSRGNVSELKRLGALGDLPDTGQITLF